VLSAGRSGGAASGRSRRWVYGLALASLLALAALCLAWEGFLAPLRPGGSWAMLKALPLLAALPGLLNARRYTAQWCSMLVLAYFAEGVARIWGEQGLARLLAGGEIVLSLVLFGACIACARIRGASPQVR
jgi:uncharacterized membrane protein